MKTPPRNSIHQGFRTTPTLHLDSPKTFSFDFIEFLMKTLLNIQWLLYHNSKQYKAALIHSHMKRILCSIQFNLGI
jgi:hemolysin-activating ACP:hemolysin acyltransferase